LPGYKTHDRLGITAAVVTTATMCAIDKPIEGVIVGVSLVVGTIWLSPDLDLDSKAISRWGFLSWLWYPYKKIVKHRSVLSHSGPLSATLRLLYLILCIGIPCFVIAPSYTTDAVYWILFSAYWWIWVYFGVVLADFVHTLADYLL